MIGRWDEGVLSNAEYIIYIISSLSMSVVSVTKTVGADYLYPIRTYEGCAQLEDHGKYFIVSRKFEIYFKKRKTNILYDKKAGRAKTLLGFYIG